MRKVNVLVCDDQPEVVEQTKELLLRYEDQFGHAMCILGVTSYDEAESFDADLLFLDIETPGKKRPCYSGRTGKKERRQLDYLCYKSQRNGVGGFWTQCHWFF